ncbi:MAG: hypothetical protein O2840_01110 [bacterium]|nr:hypothetical protein [bacterium]
MNTLWFEQYASDSLFNSVVDGFVEVQQVAASQKLLAILELAAKALLIEETEEAYQADVAQLLSTGSAEEINDWLVNQPLSIINSLKERLDRTILQVQAQLAAKGSSVILQST